MNLLEKMSRVGIVWNQNDWLENPEQADDILKLFIFDWFLIYTKKLNETFIFPLAITMAIKYEIKVCQWDDLC